MIFLVPGSAEAVTKRRGLIVRESEPPNLEMPFEEATEFVTPTERFYVRCHFPVPQVDPATWELEVCGEVEEPLRLGLETLRSMNRQTISATLECAGNNRQFLNPPMSGVQWHQGAVGNANWSGVSLGTVLERARPAKSAVEVVLEGLDRGVVEKEGAPATPISFARSIPLRKALEDVLLALEMNGQPLTPEHGFPLRAIVPGWYAMASIKWLQRIIVTDQPFAGYYQTLDYAFWDRNGGEPVRRPLSEMQVKAQIASPKEGAEVSCDSLVNVRGAAWSGKAALDRVEFSSDGGASWTEVQLTGEAERYAWRLWQCEWRTPKQPGECVLMARATDVNGRTQPEEHDRNRGSYMINLLQPVRVKVS